MTLCIEIEHGAHNSPQRPNPPTRRVDPSVISAAAFGGGKKRVVNQRIVFDCFSHLELHGCLMLHKTPHTSSGVQIRSFLSAGLSLDAWRTLPRNEKHTNQKEVNIFDQAVVITRTRPKDTVRALSCTGEMSPNREGNVSGERNPNKNMCDAIADELPSQPSQPS